MAELQWEDRPERSLLRRGIRHALRRVDPTIRVVAEGYLAENSPIDLLAVGGEGELISLRVGREADDAALLTHCLSDLAWLAPRLADLLKLAPGLGLEPSAAPRAMLLCPGFRPETRSAASNFPPGRIELWNYRCLRERGQLSVLLETETLDRRSPTWMETSLDPGFRGFAPGPEQPVATKDSNESRPAGPRAPATGGRDPLGFRTGLSDADLRIDPRDEEKSQD